MNENRVALIRQRLTDALAPEQLDIIDESHKHAGHQGAIESGGGHFKVDLVSEQFDGRTLIERHRMVYEALGDAMQSAIHALSITARSPSETDDSNSHNG